MCFLKSKAPTVKPIAQAPSVPPEIIDDASVKARDDERRKRRQAYGRQATILAGRDSTAGAPPTAAAKTALGS